MRDKRAEPGEARSQKPEASRRRWTIILLLGLAAALAGMAQDVTQVVQLSSGAPANPCGQRRLDIDVTNQNLYFCGGDGNWHGAGAAPGPDTPPAVAQPLSDEFNSGTTLDLTRWAVLNQAGSTFGINNGWLVTNIPAYNGDLLGGITQPAPSTPFAIETKVSVPPMSSGGDATTTGPALYESATTKAVFCGYGTGGATVAGGYMDPTSWLGNTLEAELAGAFFRVNSQNEYLKIIDDGTLIYFFAASDGLSWTLLTASPVASSFTTAPNEVGIFFINNTSSALLPPSTSYGADFFRQLPITAASPTDNFTSASDVNNYISAEQWTISGGNLQNTTAGIGSLVVPNLYLATSASVKGKFNGTPSGWFGASLRFNPYSGARYIGILSYGSSQVQLYLCPNLACSGATQEATAAWTPDTAQHTVTVASAAGSNVITVSVDGTQKISFTDASHTLMSGSAAIEDYGGNATYQQFSYAGQLGQ